MIVSGRVSMASLFRWGGVVLTSQFTVSRFLHFDSCISYNSLCIMTTLLQIHVQIVCFCNDILAARQRVA